MNVSLSIDASIIHKGRHFPSPETEGRFYLDLSLNPISLRIDPVSLEDAGVYKCQIEFKHKRSVQSTVNLDIIGKILRFIVLTVNAELNYLVIACKIFVYIYEIVVSIKIFFANCRNIYADNYIKIVEKHLHIR